jgi:hypothetical protein
VRDDVEQRIATVIGTRGSENTCNRMAALMAKRRSKTQRLAARPAI